MRDPGFQIDKHRMLERLSLGCFAWPGNFGRPRKGIGPSNPQLAYHLSWPVGASLQPSCPLSSAHVGEHIWGYVLEWESVYSHRDCSGKFGHFLVLSTTDSPGLISWEHDLCPRPGESSVCLLALY